MSRSKRKGTRVENIVVKALQAFGIHARRQPLSGAIQDFPHDVFAEVPVWGKTAIEVKARANGQGFAQLDRWRGKADLLILKQDRGPLMAYLPMDLIGQLVQRIRELENEDAV